jgi:predicted Zn-dependent protease
MPKRLVLASVLAALFAAAAPALRADVALKPVPVPDLSKLPPAEAEELRKTRLSFDKGKDVLIGEALSESYFLLGAAYARAGLNEAASVALADAAALSPNNGHWVYAQGVVAATQRQDAAATAFFERAFSLSPDYLPIRAALANRRMAAGDLDGARQLLESYVARHTQQAVPYAMLGDIALRQKRYADAVVQLERALKIAPDANRLYAQLAEAHAGAGDAKAAAAARAKAGQKVPALEDPIGSKVLPRRAPAAAAAAPVDPKNASMAEAMRLVGQGQYDAARKALDGALKSAPNDAMLLALYARIEAAAGNLSAAQTRATAAVSTDAKNAVGHYSLGVVREMSNDDAGAERAYAEAVRLDPKYVGARLSLGNLYLRSGRADAAAAQFRALAQAYPANSDAWARLVAAQVAGGQCAAALKEINQALAKDANNPDLLQFFARLASTCPAASAQEKRMALDYAGKLYRGRESAAIGETYALALAANGKWDDAVKTQQGAMFIVLRAGDRQDLAMYREFLQQFQAHKLPDRPWPSNAPVFHPQRAAPDPKPAPAAAPATPKK